jgi:ABC-2 type transport system ATP-binding protein
VEGISDVESEDGGLIFAGSEAAAAELSLALARADIGIRALVPRTASLEELFFELIEPGGEAGERAA